jgi:branched-chain amino acid transport system permease protein
MEALAGILFQGLILGSQWAAFAVCFGLVVRVLGVFHIAISGIYTVGLFAAVMAVDEYRVPTLVAVVIGAAFAGAASFLCYALMYRPMMKRLGGRFEMHALTPVVASLGAATVLFSLVQLLAGAEPRGGSAADLGALRIFGASARIWDMMTAAIVFIVIATFEAWLRHTRLGKSTIALEQNFDGARIIGVRPEKVYVVLFLSTGAAAGIAGSLQGLGTATVAGSSLVQVLFAALIVLVLPDSNLLVWAGGAVAMGCVYAALALQFGTSWAEVLVQGLLILVLVIGRVLVPRTRTRRRRPLSRLALTPDSPDIREPHPAPSPGKADAHEMARMEGEFGV